MRSSTASKYAIGIDLGTSYSKVAVLKDGKVQIISNEEGKSKIPSYVCFSNDNNTYVGNLAKKKSAAEPNNTVFGLYIKFF
jgi:endoplasmic reticulum chaperone BiP